MNTGKLLNLVEDFLLEYCSEVYKRRIRDVDELKFIKPVVNIGENDNTLCIDFYDSDGFMVYIEVYFDDFIENNRKSFISLVKLIIFLNDNEIVPNDLRIELRRNGEIKVEVDEEVVI